jgi:hypothetical protein
VIVAGSTMKGEETAVLRAFRRVRTAQPNTLLLLAPRNPERFGEVDALCRAEGWKVARRSDLAIDAEPRVDIVVLDTIGELATIYQVATVVPWAAASGGTGARAAMVGSPLLGPQWRTRIAPRGHGAGIKVAGDHDPEGLLLMSDPCGGAPGAAARALQLRPKKKRGRAGRPAAGGCPLIRRRQALQTPRPILYAEVTRVRRWAEQHPQRRPAGPARGERGQPFDGRHRQSPVVAIAEWLVAQGERPAILSRGYARANAVDGVVVVSDGTSVRAGLDVSGDEPLMLARQVPGAAVCVSPDRYLAGTLAETALGCTVHVLDDGFQHLELARDLDVLVTTLGEIPGGRVLPMGRLREPIDAASERTAGSRRQRLGRCVGGWALGISQACGMQRRGDRQRREAGDGRRGIEPAADSRPRLRLIFPAGIGIPSAADCCVQRVQVAARGFRIIIATRPRTWRLRPRPRGPLPAPC